MKNRQLNHLLEFSVGERRGIVLFLVLNLLVIVVPVVNWKYFSDKNDQALMRIEPLPQNFLSIASDSNQTKTEPLANAVKLFFFDLKGR